MQKASRIIWLDAVKGIGILLIMIVHMNALPFNTQFLIAGYVSMFFVASGLTFNQNTDIRTAIGKKVRRLLIPYFFYTVSFVAITYALACVLGKDIDIKYKILGILYSKYYLAPIHLPQEPFLLNGANAPAWFLTSLFTSYILVYLWQQLKQSKVLLIVYFLLAILLTELPIFLPWSLDMAPLGALLIITGFKAKNILCSPTYHKWFILVFVIYLCVVYFNGKTNMSLREYGELGMVSTIFFYFIGIGEFWLWSVLCRIAESSRTVCVLAYIGRNSLRLMCIHMFFWLTFKDMILSRIGQKWNLLLVLMAFIVIFLANHIINIICNKYKGKLSLLKYI